MTEGLYERYREALRRGHVAVLRGRPDEALEAYAEAATLAPERPLAHASIGAIHLRQGRVDEALAAFGAALERSPRDEGSLLGRADALARAGRPAEAAALLDTASAVQEAAGRPADALASTRHALALAESRARRRTADRLAALTGAPAGPEAVPEDETTEPAAALIPADAEAAAAEGAAIAAEDARPPVEGVSSRDGSEEAPVGPAGVAEAAPGCPGDPVELARTADAALAGDDPAAALRALLAAAAAHEAAGQRDAAIDDCYRAIALAPDDPGLHLALVDLYRARGWDVLAAEKLGLLERLVELDGDEAALAAVRARSVASGGRGNRIP